MEPSVTPFPSSDPLNPPGQFNVERMSRRPPPRTQSRRRVGEGRSGAPRQGTRRHSTRRRPSPAVIRRRRSVVLVGVVALALVLFLLTRPAHTTHSATSGPLKGVVAERLPALHHLAKNPPVGDAIWRLIGRLVGGDPAVYRATIKLPDAGYSSAAVAWMNTQLLRAQLYSGSLSPGGLFWHFTAPVLPAASRKLVVAFDGGYQLKDSHGGYLSEGHLVQPLRVGGASLVIYRDGVATVGAWGRDVHMTPKVIAVRQNLTLIVDHGHPVAGLKANDINTWGYSLSARPIVWRSGIGVTRDGALVYAAGEMTITNLAAVLTDAGAIRAMTLDMNYFWTIFASYVPQSPGGEARPSNGTDLLSSMYQTPQRFFNPAYFRDFITMSMP